MHFISLSLRAFETIKYYFFNNSKDNFSYIENVKRKIFMLL